MNRMKNMNTEFVARVIMTGIGFLVLTLLVGVKLTFQNLLGGIAAGGVTLFIFSIWYRKRP